MTLHARFSALATVVALSGCQSCPQYQASWYLTEKGPDAPTLYIALLHDGARPTVLRGAVLNPEGDGISGWALKLNKALPSGGLLVLPATAFKKNGMAFGHESNYCQLPVTVQVQCESSDSAKKLLTSTVPVTGKLPNYLHDRWLEECVI